LRLIVDVENLVACRTNKPHAGERAPKPGLPDFGNLKVSKSAAADFDARVSKHGRWSLPCGHPSRRALKKRAPQDEVSLWETEKRNASVNP